MIVVLSGWLSVWMYCHDFFERRMSDTLQRMMRESGHFYWPAFRPMGRFSHEKQTHRAYRQGGGANVSVRFVENSISLKAFEAQVEEFVTEIGTNAKSPKRTGKLIVSTKFRPDSSASTISGPDGDESDDDDEVVAHQRKHRKAQTEICDRYGITFVQDIDTWVEIMLSSKGKDKLDLTPLEHPGVLHDKFRAAIERERLQKEESKSIWSSMHHFRAKAICSIVIKVRSSKK